MNTSVVKPISIWIWQNETEKIAKLFAGSPTMIKMIYFPPSRNVLSMIDRFQLRK